MNHHVWSLFWDLSQCQTFADLDSLRDKHPSAHGSLMWKWSCQAWNDRCYSLSGTQLLLQRAAEVTGLSVRVSLRGFEPASQSCSPALHFMPLVFCRLCILAGESPCKKCCTKKRWFSDRNKNGQKWKTSLHLLCATRALENDKTCLLKLLK